MLFTFICSTSLPAVSVTEYRGPTAMQDRATTVFRREEGREGEVRRRLKERRRLTYDNMKRINKSKIKRKCK